jgi:glycosyltransferase involved in cell wall biosynthesis
VHTVNEQDHPDAPGADAPPPVRPAPVDSRDDALLSRLDDLERRLRDTQAMASRAYEASFGYPDVLEEIRADPGYELAFEGEPLVSVRIATYNQSELLCSRALETLRRQTYVNWEALVVGDNCEDDTEQRVAAIGDPRIRFWNLPVRGPYPADAQARWFVAGLPPMNAGIQASRGAWIAPLDHDDEWDDDHIDVLLAAAQAERAELAYSSLRVIDDTTGAMSEIGRWPPELGHFAFQGAIHHGGLRRFLYDMNCRFAGEPGDWNLARRMWAAGVRFTYVDRPTGTYHHVPKHRTLSADERLIEELRGWSSELQEGLEWWKQRATWFEAELARARGGSG